MERELEVVEVLGWELFGEQLPQRFDGVQVSAGPDQGDRAPHPGLAEYHTQRLASPEVGEPFGRAVRVGGNEGAVDRADGGADDQVGAYVGFAQGAQHAYLVRAEQPPAAEHERSG